jgi:cysteine desulfurase/selenocysteine lyase
MGRREAEMAVALASSFDVQSVRRDFPALAARVHGRPLVYLDSGASAQKPRVVLETMNEFLAQRYANVHRGVHALSEAATTEYDAARQTARRFLGAAEAAEVIFTSGTTASINLVAQSWGRAQLRPGDEILVTELEHHSNIVPWQLIAGQTGAVVRPLPITAEGDLDLAALESLLSPRTRLVALAHVSNVLGTVNPVRRVADLAHDAGALVLVDGAQAVPHMPVDVRAIGADFYACSGHKLYGPTGVGLLYARLDLLEAMPPWQGGGGMIDRVTFERTTYAPPPDRFEAGTPPIAEALGLAAAIDYLGRLDAEALQAHEESVLRFAERTLASLPGIRVVGNPAHRAGVLSFVVDGVHPHDVGTILDRDGVAVRAGHHCAQPLMRRLGLGGTVRASFGMYNTVSEVEALAESLTGVRKVMGL